MKSLFPPSAKHTTIKSMGSIFEEQKYHDSVAIRHTKKQTIFCYFIWSFGKTLKP